MKWNNWKSKQGRAEVLYTALFLHVLYHCMKYQENPLNSLWVMPRKRNRYKGKYWKRKIEDLVFALSRNILYHFTKFEQNLLNSFEVMPRTRKFSKEK